MLARNPLSQTWSDDSDFCSRLIEGGVTLAIIDRSCGRWDGRIEQAVIPHKSNTTRSTLGGLQGYTSREAAKIAVEDFIHAVRNPDPVPVSDEAALVALEARRRTFDEYEDNPAALTAFDVLQHRWVR